MKKFLLCILFTILSIGNIYSQQFQNHEFYVHEYLTHNFVDDVYIYKVDYENIDNIIFYLDIDNTESLDINKIIKNVAIGESAIFISSLIITYYSGIPISVIIIGINKEAIIGSIIDSVVSGIVEYAKTEGNLKSSFYRSIEGFSEGFKWGAIFSSGKSLCRNLKVNPNKTIATPSTNISSHSPNTSNTNNIKKESYVNFSEVSEKYNSININPKVKLSKKDFITKYGQNTYNDIFAYSSTQNTKLRAAAEGTLSRDAEGIVNGTKYVGTAYKEKLIERNTNIESFLLNHSFKEEALLYRGTDFIELEKNLKLGNINNLDEAFNLLKKNKNKTFYNTFFTSTSEDLNKAMGYAYKTNDSSLHNIPCVYEIKARKGTHGFNISEISKYKENEVLLSYNTEFKIIDCEIIETKTVMNDITKHFKALKIILEAF